MPRRMRHAKGGYVYHVLNRAVGRATLFAKATDYEAFVRVLSEELALPARAALCGAQPAARRAGAKCAAMALEQPGPSDAGIARPAIEDRPGRETRALARVGGPTGNRGRVDRIASERGPRRAVRRGIVAATDGQTSGPGVESAAPWAVRRKPKKSGKNNDSRPVFFVFYSTPPRASVPGAPGSSRHSPHDQGEAIHLRKPLAFK
jgi:hypothetical protein